MNKSDIEPQQELIRSRCSTQQFLFSTTESTHTIDRPISVPPAGIDQLREKIPAIRTGKEFIDHALKELETSAGFGALVIRIDNFDNGKVPLKETSMANVQLEVAKTIEAVCKNDVGTWGLLDADIFGCFFNDQNGSSSHMISEKLKELLAEKLKETISIGIAVFPSLSYQKSHILENALKALDHAAFLGPDSTVAFDAVSLNISGDQLYQQGHLDEAIEEFKSALLMDSSNINVLNSLGVCYGIMGAHQKALEIFEKVLSVNPDEIMALYNTGHVHMLLGNMDKALGYSLKALDLGEDVFEVVFQAGRIYMETGHPEKGKTFLEKALDLNPDSAAPHRFFGDYYVEKDSPKKAIEAYKTAIIKNPNDASALSSLGVLFDQKGENLEIATMFCRQSVDIEPDNGLFRNRLGVLLLKQNCFEDARKTFEKATELGHDSTEQIKKMERENEECHTENT